MGKRILQLQNISKYYHSETSVTQALRRVNLEFGLGEFVAVTGESGSGKSTLLNVISGLDTFDEGEMYFKGEPTFQYDEQEWEEYRRNEIGFVFQDYSLIGHYTALDNVMAALVIREWDQREARRLAWGYLEQVGLKEFAEQRASQLSSGQKQRLAIARALAKNTDMIVADEPTGNLDSETGEQIIQLLKELSREKLVIMVTHNQEQAEPYVSRKIRLHDGEVVADVVRNQEGKQEKTFGQEKEREVLGRGKQQEETLAETDGADAHNKGENKEKRKRNTNHMAAFFARRNIQMQPERAALFLTFFLVTAMVSFLFIGELQVYADDRITKDYNPEMFMQQNDTRLVVRYPDNRDLTQKDQEKLRSVRYVEEVDLYDYCNDVKYYFREGEGYEYYYGEQQKVTDKNAPAEAGEEKSYSYQETKGVRFLAENQFMRSSSCLTAEDLAEGRLPEARDEVVVYSKDPSILGKGESCFFTADNLWNKGEVFQTQVKVVGILKEATDQVYFDHRMCQMITVILDRIGYSLDFYYVREFGRYLGNIKFYPMVAQDLKGNEIRVSKYVMIPNTSYGVIPTDLARAFGGTCLLHIHKINDAGDYSELDTKKVKDAGTAVRAPGKRQDGIEVTALGDQLSEQGPDIIEVSEELFQKLYDKKTTQASVYITSYSKTDAVLDTLQDMGYDAISTYRTSTINYIQEKVVQRLEVIGISVIVLIVMVILQILLIRSILKIKRKDYQVLQFIGMHFRQMKGITYLEMGTHCLVSIVSAPLLMLVLSALGIPFFVTLMQYYTLPGVACFILYNMLLMILTVGSFHRLLKQKV